MTPILEDGRFPWASPSPTGSLSPTDEKTGFLSKESLLANGIIDEDCLIITEATESDPIELSPGRRFVSRFLFVSGLIPCILAFWATRIQLGALTKSTAEHGLPTWKVALMYWSIGYDLICSCM